MRERNIMIDTIDKIIEGNDIMQKGGVEATLKYIQRDIAEINQKLDDKYVTKDQFSPVRNIVYGMVTIILTAVVVALVYLVINHS